IDVAAWDLPPVFTWLAEAGALTPQDLAGTLNTGIGMVVVCDAGQKDIVQQRFEASGETVFEIGEIQKRNGSDLNVKLENLNNWAV
ncbi:MAG: AIR synthase-related protein, partial [Bdellovibrionales bacterium]